MKELFSLVPLLKNIKLSLDADLKRVKEYAKDADDDYIKGMTFNNYELSDMPHSNTNSFHSTTENGALLYQQTIDNEAKENKKAVKEIIKEIYCIEVILDKIEIGLKGLTEIQKELLPLKYWEAKTWNEVAQHLKNEKKYYSEWQIQANVKKAIKQINIIAMIDMESYKKVKSLIKRSES